MDSKVELSLQNILAGTASDDEVALLKQKISSGQISIGGNVTRSVIILGEGNTVQLTPQALEMLNGRSLLGDLERDLTPREIETGLNHLTELLPDRAPILTPELDKLAKRFLSILRTDPRALSAEVRNERSEMLGWLNSLCLETTEIAFNALCTGVEPPAYDSRSPFRGLESFRPEDAEYFFGREELTKKLVWKLNEHNFLAVLGASGSGKSSLVMAGLIPVLNIPYAIFRPGAEPLSELEKALQGNPVILVVDQFEELFTLSARKQCSGFISCLLEQSQQIRVVITLRADFLGDVASFKSLKDEVENHQVIIPPMDKIELYRAMEDQAACAGLRFESDLGQQMLDDVTDEPGAMPLLQHALWTLWQRRHGRWLRAEEYRGFGGVKKAIASTAEAVFAHCTDFEKVRLRDIFLRLTRLDESADRRDTRRRVLLNDLILADRDPDATKLLIKQLADARLVIVTGDEVEVAHEALIRYWDRLRAWLNDDRDNLRLRESISDAAKEWEKSGRHESLLNSRWVKLDDALLYLRDNSSYGLTAREQAYLGACAALRDREQRERERRQRWTVIGVSVAAFIFMVLGSFGWVKSNDATNQAATAQANANIASTQKANAESAKSTAVANEQEAKEQANIALARQIVIQAPPLLDGKPQVAVPLAIQSMRLLPSGEAAQVLRANPLGHLVARMTHDSAINAVAFSPDGKFVVSSGSFDKTARVWSVETGQEVARMMHDDQVNAVAFSPDGKYVVSGSDDNTARVWSVETGQEVARMTHDSWVEVVVFSPDGKYVVSAGCHKRSGGITIKKCTEEASFRIWEAATGIEIARMLHNANTVAFSPDGKYVVSGSADGNVRIWLAETGQEIIRMTHDSSVSDVMFSPDGKYVVSGSDDNTARVWLVERGQEVARMTHDSSVSDVMFSPNGKYVVSGSDDDTARVWSAETGQELARMTHDDNLNAVVFSPDGKYVVSGSWDNTARVWMAETGQEIARMTHDDWVNAVAFSPDGRYIVSGSNNNIVYVWLAETGQEVARMTHDHNSGVNAVAFSSNGKYVVSGSDDDTARVWTAETEQEVARMTHGDQINAVAFSPDGKYVVSGSWDNTARVWMAETGQEIARMTHDDWVNAIAFSSDGKYVVSGSQDGTARVWLAETGQEVARMTHDHNRAVNAVAFSPNGKYVVSASDDETARVWRAETGQEVARMTHDSGVNAVAFSPDGKYVISSGGYDKTARVWSANTGQEIARITHDAWVRAVAFSPDGKYIVSGSDDKTARVWRVETGQEVARMTHDNELNTVAFSSDGKYVVSGSDDKTARVWLAETGQEVARMMHGSFVSVVAFSPDGKYVVSGSLDDTARVWLWHPEDLITIACLHVPRNLTHAEWQQYIGDALPYRAVCQNLPTEPEPTAMPTP